MITGSYTLTWDLSSVTNFSINSDYMEDCPHYEPNMGTVQSKNIYEADYFYFPNFKFFPDQKFFGTLNLF